MIQQPSALYWIGTKCRAFLLRDLFFETSYKLQSFFRFLSVLFQLLTFYYLSQLVTEEGAREHLASYGGDYFTFALIGLAFSGFLNAGLIGFTTALRQQMTMGVLEAMAAAPLRSASFFAYSLLWPIGFELIKSFFYLFVGSSLLGAEAALTKWPLLATTLLLSLLVFGSLGIIAGSLILYFKRGDPIAWFMSSATLLLGGVLFPVTVLPSWLEKFALVIPVAYALDALRLSLIPGADTSLVFRDWIALVVFALVTVPMALWAARVALDRCRDAGNLGQF